MYCIKVNVSAEKYVCSCDNGSFRLCEKKSDAKKFASLEELLAGAVCSGLRDEDFEVVSTDDNAGKESAVFGKSCDNIITFTRLAAICEEGSANSTLKPGDKLEHGYIIVAVKPDAVKIWSPKDSLGDMNWNDASKVADNYAITWNRNNSELPVLASRSELLSKEEAESLPQSYRMTGFYYWTSTGISSGRHWRVDSDGSLYNSLDSYDFDCCPGIWVGASEASEGSSENDAAITFERLREICEEGSADLVLKPGDTLENGYIVAATKPDAVKIWSPENYLGDMNWQDATKAAENYCYEWDDSGLPIIATRSELLSKEEVEVISGSDRATDFNYWTDTEFVDENHWIVSYNGSLSTGLDRDGYGCCPGIWVR